MSVEPMTAQVAMTSLFMIVLSCSQASFYATLAQSVLDHLLGARASGDTVRLAIHGAAMIEVFVEYWANGKAVHHPWSIWVDGKQMAGSHGRREYASRDESEKDALKFCEEVLKKKPNLISRL